MTEKETQLLERTKAFIRALEKRDSFEDLRAFYHPDITQIEYPNALTKQTAVRNLTALAEASGRGKQVLQKETYEIVQGYVAGNAVILEVIWTGVVAVQVGAIPPGGAMKAHFAQFFEYADGKIIRQRNYDCFEPFN